MTFAEPRARASIINIVPAAEQKEREREREREIREIITRAKLYWWLTFIILTSFVADAIFSTVTSLTQHCNINSNHSMRLYVYFVCINIEFDVKEHFIAVFFLCTNGDCYQLYLNDFVCFVLKILCNRRGFSASGTLSAAAEAIFGRATNIEISRYLIRPRSAVTSKYANRYWQIWRILRSENGIAMKVDILVNLYIFNE